MMDHGSWTMDDGSWTMDDGQKNKKKIKDFATHLISVTIKY